MTNLVQKLLNILGDKKYNSLTICRVVTYFFHHKYFCIWGPKAANI